jgi:hypothetical protein
MKEGFGSKGIAFADFDDSIIPNFAHFRILGGSAQQRQPHGCSVQSS